MKQNLVTKTKSLNSSHQSINNSAVQSS